MLLLCYLDAMSSSPNVSFSCQSDSCVTWPSNETYCGRAKACCSIFAVQHAWLQYSCSDSLQVSAAWQHIPVITHWVSIHSETEQSSAGYECVGLPPSQALWQQASNSKCLFAFRRFDSRLYWTLLFCVIASVACNLVYAIFVSWLCTWSWGCQ